MDPTLIELLTATLSGLVSGGAGVAGAQALEALDRLRGGAPAPATSDDVPGLARRLVELAGSDAEFERELLAWLRGAQATLAASGGVVNSISGVVLNSSITQTGVSTAK